MTTTTTNEYNQIYIFRSDRTTFDIFLRLKLKDIYQKKVLRRRKSRFFLLRFNDNTRPVSVCVVFKCV